MYHGYIDVPTFAYFDFGNTWTGSLLSEFNYRIVPKKPPKPKKGEEPPANPEPACLEVTVWYGKDCLAVSEPQEVFKEDYSAEGYEKVIAALNERIEKYRSEVAYGGAAL
ncbi:MAG: hypothetical protein K6B74_00780 [Ruminococcus sp.]|nr:hypothetical protein [Ruminococcus sp.]